MVIKCYGGLADSVFASFPSLTDFIEYFEALEYLKGLENSFLNNSKKGAFKIGRFRKNPICSHEIYI